MSAKRSRLVTLGGVVGGMVGFGLAAGVYLLLNPVVDASDTWVEELQGLLWNVVPLGTVIGVIVGVFLARRLAQRRLGHGGRYGQGVPSRAGASLPSRRRR